MVMPAAIWRLHYRIPIADEAELLTAPAASLLAQCSLLALLRCSACGF